MKRPKVLIYTSSATQIPHREGGGHETGTWLSEIADTMPPLYEDGAEFVFATPDGNPCIIDEASKNLLYYNFNKTKLKKELEFIKKLDAVGFKSPLGIKEVLANRELLDSLDALFMPGGHAPMTDVLFKNWFDGDEINQDTSALLAYFHKEQKPTGSICHGPANFGAAPIENGKWIYDGYQFTCVSMLGEWLTEDIPFLGQKGHLKDYPKHILERLGGKVSNVMMLRSLVVEDREVMTGQDPYSGKELSVKFRDKVLKWIRENR